MLRLSVQPKCAHPHQDRSTRRGWRLGTTALWVWIAIGPGGFCLQSPAHALDGNSPALTPSPPSGVQAPPAATPPGSRPPPASPPSTGAPQAQSAGSYSRPTWTGSTGPSGSNAWYDPGNPFCRQGCTYDKANESLIQLLHYTEEKYLAVRTAVSSGTPEERDQARESIQGFCATPSESLDDCWGRYSRYTLLEMARIRRSIMENETAGAKLMSKRVSADGRATEGGDVAVVGVMPTSNTPLGAPQVVHLPKLDELKARRRADLERASRMQAAVSEGFAQWLNSYPVEPSPADFVKFKRIRRDPDDPSKGFFTVVETNAQGTPQIDTAAYEEARKAYQNSIALLRDDQRVLRERYQGQAGASRSGPVVAPSLRPIEQVDHLSRQAYADSRGRIVDAVNGRLREGGYQPRPVGSTGAPPSSTGRTPSGTPSPAPQGPMGAPGGAPPLGGGARNLGNVSTTTNEVTGFTGRTRYTGNEEILNPSATRENQQDTNSLRIRMQHRDRQIRYFMRQDVELPHATDQEVVREINGMELPPITPND